MNERNGDWEIYLCRRMPSTENSPRRASEKPTYECRRFLKTRRIIFPIESSHWRNQEAKCRSCLGTSK